ncbi:MAG: hypothetical protein KIT22_17395, partial [Verrucomicrobiae bacterium]|nr:hypothetical protein [Verrucomicrobiae bacterium]
MNPPVLSDWTRLLGLLALEGLLVAGLAWAIAQGRRSAAVRRSVWQVALAALGLIAVVEWAGLR